MAPAPRRLPLTGALDRGPGPQARIGAIVLASDATVEPTFRALGLAPAVELYASRIAFTNPTTVDSLRAMAGDVTRAAALLMPEARLDAIAFACTSGTVVIGEAEVIAAVRAARPGIPVTTPVTAAVAAFRRMGIARVAMLTPYLEEVSGPVAAFLEANGVGVTDLATFGLDSDVTMARVPLGAILDAARAVRTAGADGLFISCTALRAAEAIEALERELEFPVVASNQAMFWHALRLAGYDRPVSRFGRLMTLA
jgi:maleate isomerase